MSSRSSGMCGLHATESPLRHYSGLPNKSSTNTNIALSKTFARRKCTLWLVSLSRHYNTKT